MSGCVHVYVYGGLLNIFDGERLLKVFEYWRCNKCGIVRASFRNADTISPMQGLLPEPKTIEEKWIILVCSIKKDAEIFSARIGDEIIHSCKDGELKLLVSDGYKVKDLDGKELRDHSSFLLEEISPGYIDLSYSPVRVARTSST